MRRVDTLCRRATRKAVWRGNILSEVTSPALFTMYTVISMIIYAANMRRMHTAGDDLPKKERKEKKNNYLNSK